MAEQKRSRKLTKRLVDVAKPRSCRYTIWDSELAGFGLRVEPTGRKTFIARYRAGGGRSGTLRQATIGRYGTLTPDHARMLARKTLGAAASGSDPVGEKKKDREPGITVSQVCDWYLEQAEAGRNPGPKGAAYQGIHDCHGSKSDPDARQAAHWQEADPQPHCS